MLAAWRISAIGRPTERPTRPSASELWLHARSVEIAKVPSVRLHFESDSDFNFVSVEFSAAFFHPRLHAEIFNVSSRRQYHDYFPSWQETETQTQPGSMTMRED